MHLVILLTAAAALARADDVKWSGLTLEDLVGTNFSGLAAGPVVSSSAAPGASDTARGPASWPAHVALKSSVAYVPPRVHLAQLPKLDWSLASESTQFRTSLCGHQIVACAISGCTHPSSLAEGEEVTLENFCEEETLASRCSCSPRGKTQSRLPAYEWPVHTYDCRLRGGACEDACRNPHNNVTDIRACTSTCRSTFGQNCGLPGQVSASYAVSQSGDKPQLTLAQGADLTTLSLAATSPAAVQRPFLPALLLLLLLLLVPMALLAT